MIRSIHFMAHVAALNLIWTSIGIAQLLSPPCCDSFLMRTNLGNLFHTGVVGTNVGFTGEVGEPSQSGAINSAWWQWTAPTSAQFTIDTVGSDFDTFLTLATGMAVDALTVLAHNDDSLGLQSQIVFDGVMGTDYQIAVDGYADHTGSIVLNIIPEPSTLSGGLIFALASLGYVRRRKLA